MQYERTDSDRSQKSELGFLSHYAQFLQSGSEQELDAAAVKIMKRNTRPSNKTQPVSATEEEKDTRKDTRSAGAVSSYKHKRKDDAEAVKDTMAAVKVLLLFRHSLSSLIQYRKNRKKSHVMLHHPHHLCLNLTNKINKTPKTSQIRMNLSLILTH